MLSELGKFGHDGILIASGIGYDVPEVNKRVHIHAFEFEPGPFRDGPNSNGLEPDNDLRLNTRQADRDVCPRAEGDMPVIFHKQAVQTEVLHLSSKRGTLDCYRSIDREPYPGEPPIIHSRNLEGKVNRWHSCRAVMHQ
jgi:hypothetical protein